MWFLYIILTKNNKLYTGITTDLYRRFYEHQSSKKGAKFTRANPPQEIVYTEFFDDMSSAAKRECEVKGLSRSQKLQLITTSITK